MKRIVVVGGGITGLTAAYRLHQKLATPAETGVQNPPLLPPLQKGGEGGFEILLLEASDRLGGVMRTSRQEGFLLEGGPDCFLSEKPAGIKLCEELGLAGDLIGTNQEYQRSFIVLKGKFHPVPEGLYLMAPSRLRPFLASSLLSWRGKWRVLAEPLVPARRPPSPAVAAATEGGSDESVASFVRRRLGVEALERLAQPLLAGIYSADPETLSLRATFPQFLEMEEKYGSLLLGLKKSLKGARHASGARYSLFVSLRDGMQTLVDHLASKLPKEQVWVGVGVKALKFNPLTQSPSPRGEGRSEGPWQLLLSDGQTLDADGVCLALPAWRCAELLRPVHNELANQLNSISYTDTATVNLAFRDMDIGHPLDGFGFVVPSTEKRAVTACTFAHRKFTGRAPEGHALLRAFVGGALQKDLLDLDDNALQQQIFQDLRGLLGLKNPPLFCVIQRWQRAMPQYTLGHFHRLLQIEETLLGLKGLGLAGNWQRGVGVPDCIESGERAAAALIDYFDS